MHGSMNVKKTICETVVTEDSVSLPAKTNIHPNSGEVNRMFPHWNLLKEN